MIIEYQSLFVVVIKRKSRNHPYYCDETIFNSWIESFSSSSDDDDELIHIDIYEVNFIWQNV